MLKLLNYIVLMIFFLVAPAAAWAQYVIDKVCQDAVRTYRVDGELGLTYNWILTDISGTTVLNSPGVIVSDGGEITIDWTFVPGTYSLSVEKTSSFGCPIDTLGTIEVVPVPVVNAGLDQTVCAFNLIKLTDATATDLTASGLEWTSSGDGTFSDPFTVNPEYTPGSNDLLAGKVTLKLTAKSPDEGDGCLQEDEIEITIIPLPVLVITDPGPVCEPGVVDLTDTAVTDGSTIPSAATFTYWEDAATTVSVINPNQISKSGAYYIKLDVNGLCPDIQPVNVVLNPAPDLVVHNPPEVCSPATVDLSMPSVTAGSDPGLTYEYYADINGTVQLSGAIVSVGGTYYIKGISASYCSTIQLVVVVINLPAVPVFDLKYAYCQSGLAPILPTSSINTPVITGTWSPSTVDMSKTGTTKYKFTPDANQCAVPYIIDITITDHIHSKFDPVGPFCVGSPATLPSTSTNGITGTWNPSILSTAVSGLFTFKFTPDADQCALDTTLQIKVNDPINPSFDPIEACQNTTTNPLPAKSKEGISGTWSPAYTSVLAGPATYKFTPNAGECANPVNLTITINPEKIPVFAPIGPFCVNSVPPLLPSSDQNGISGTWNPVVISTSTIGTNNYVFTPASGICGKPVSVPITIIGLSLSAKTSDLGYSNLPIGEIDLTVTGGSGDYSYSWTSPNGFTASTQDLVGLAVGDYTVIVTDNQTTCTETKTIPIKNNFLVDYNWNPVSCFGRADGTATAIVSGGTAPYHFLWKKDGLVVSTDQTATGLVAGNYTLEATDNMGLGMPKPAAFTITQPERLQISAKVKVSCFGANDGSISVKVSGGPIGAETVIWINGLKTDSLTGLSKGDYVIHIENPCGRDTVVKITEPPLMTLKAIASSGICTGTIQLSTTNVPDGIYEVFYDGGQFSGVKVLNNSANITASGGTYKNLSLLVDECLVPGNDVTVTDPPKILVSAKVTAQPTCADATGAIQLSSLPAPGLTYSIDGLDYTNTTGIFTGLTAGDYTGTVKDSNGCISLPSNKVTINEQPVPPAKPIAQASTQPNCTEAAGTITVISPKGPGLSYSIDGAIFTNMTGVFTGLSAGDYQITAQISGGCISVISDAVTILPQPAIPSAPIAIPVPPECEEKPIQKIYAHTGIVAPPAGISINWYDVNGNPVNDPFLNKAETITYFAESTNGICVSPTRTAVTLTIKPQPEILVNQNPVEECAETPLQTLNANDYVAVPSGISLIWWDAELGGNKVAKPVLKKIGTITYYAETFNGICTSPARTGIILTINKLPSIPEAKITSPPSCKDEHGVIEITSPLGPEYEYRIDGGAYQASVVFTELISKTYTLQVRNINTGCESSSIVLVMPAIPPAPEIKSAFATDCLCFGYDGSINFEFLNVEDGSYVIVYVGRDNKPGEFLNVQVTKGLATVAAKAGTYNILAIQANGCTSEAYNKSVVIEEPPRLSVSSEITEIDLKSGQKGEIDLTITGGTPMASQKYQILWEPSIINGFAGASTEDIKNLEDGDYVAKITDQNGCLVDYTGIIPLANQPPIATNNEFNAGCGGVSGDLLYTIDAFGNGIDYDPDGDTIMIDTTAIQMPPHGLVVINPDGTFEYQSIQGFTGVDIFKYQIYDVKNNFSIPATVTIHVVSDFDCDGFVDDLDSDADGDGILNVDEGKDVDTDGDGHPNWLDIDADNDGIVDNIEAQPYSSGYIPPKGLHSDNDGLDDAYDTDEGNTNLKPIDTDLDGIPDFLDSDSDNDLVPDYIEGHDGNDADGKPENVLLGKDADADGLDDGFDIVNRYKSPLENMTGSNAAMQDFDRDGIHDWRDENDDDDKYPTRFEDLNADHDFSNDDIDYDGHPEYLDYGRDCELFIPDAFSPNDDNIHEYFQIFCIEQFPDAKMYIFDQFGNKLFEKEHYGNLDVWASPDQAWWDGRTSNRSAAVNNGKVTPGTYFYVLKLGNGEVKKSFVFVSY